MSCLSSPEPVAATKSEKALVNLARDKHDYSEKILKPLQEFDRNDAKKLDNPNIRQLTVNRSVNTARENIPKVKVSPNNRRSLVLKERMTADTLAKSAASGEMTDDRTKTNKDVRNFATGLKLSLNGSQIIKRAAANETGYREAEASANNHINDAKYNALGTAVGAAGTTYGYKKGWFDPKPETDDDGEG